MIDLKAIAVEMDEWHSRTFPGKTVQEIALKLGEESGEAQAAIVKRGETERGERAPGVPWNEELRGELGDVLCVVMVLAEREGFDIEQIIKDVRAANLARSWV